MIAAAKSNDTLKVPSGRTKGKKSEAADETKDESKPELIRKFSLGGDAWNKKSTAKRKVTSGVKYAIDTIDDDEDEGRWDFLSSTYKQTL